ncbi:MAG: hypothetical protein J1F61_05220 [Clostridiales bacterium]|nr:hypothetical protein [Clostridiales bacterium]
MERLLCFVRVDFIDDPNVSGYGFWYWSEFREAEVGDWIVAPIGKHNKLQEGIITAVTFRTEDNAPYPFEFIKKIKELKKTNRIK